MSAVLEVILRAKDELTKVVAHSSSEMKRFNSIVADKNVLATERMIHETRLNQMKSGTQKELALLDYKFDKMRERYKNNAKALENVNTAYGMEKSGVLNAASAQKSMLIAGGLVTAITGVTLALGLAYNQSVEFGSTINDNAAKMQLSTDDFQKWDYVARQAGTSAEQLAGGFQKIKVTAYDALGGSKTAQQAFAALGVSVKDSNGNLKNSSQIIQDSVFAIADVKNSTERAALAQKVFGKSCAELLPILSQGKDALKEQIAETEKYGLILSNDTIKKLDDAGDATYRMNTSIKVMKAEIMVGLAPAFTSLSNAIAKAASGIRSFIAPNTDEKIKDLEKYISVVEKYQAGKFTWDLGMPGSHGDLSGRLSRYNSELAGLKSSKSAPEADSVAVTAAAATAAAEAAETARKSAEKAAEAARKRIDGYQKQVEQMSSSWGYADAQARVEASQRLYSTFKTDAEASAKYSYEKRVEADSAIKSLDELRINSMAEGANKELALIQFKYDAIKEAHKGNATALLADDKAYEIEKSNMESASRKKTLSETISNLKVIGGQWRQFAGAYKAIAIAQTLWDTYQSATASYKSLAGIPYVGPALGFAAAGVAVGAGLANVAQIKAAKYALGTDMITNGPHLFIAGDNPGGRERVSVTPMSSPNVNGPRGTEAHFHFYGDNRNETDRIRRDIRSGKADKLVEEFMQRAARFA